MLNGFDDSGFNFKDAYGKDFDEMTLDEKLMHVMMQLYYLRQGTRAIPWLKRMVWAAAIIIPFMMGLLVWLIQMHMAF